MVLPKRAWWRSFAAFLQGCTLLSLSAEGRPFKLLSGLESLPDDDIDSVSPSFASDAVVRPVLRRAGPASRRMPRMALPTVSQEPVTSGTAETVWARLATHGRPPAVAKKCRDIRRDVVIESGFRGNADVFSGGRVASPWDPGSATFQKLELPSSEEVVAFVVETGTGATLAQPKVAVSDPSILTVELVDKRNAMHASQVVLSSKHVCKRPGVATVTIALHLRKDAAVAMLGPLCQGSLSPLVFAYRKACGTSSDDAASFMKAHRAFLVAESQLHEPTVVPIVAIAVPTEKPWNGIIPSGGVRTVLVVVLVFLLAIVLYELGNHWLSRKIQDMIINMAPNLFGTECQIEHCSLQVSPLRMSYTMTGLRLKNPPGGEYTKECFMTIDEVKVWFNLRKLIMTCGKEIEIRQLVAKHIQANIEVDGYLYGEPNIAKVLVQLDKNNKEWKETCQHVMATHGIDINGHLNNFTSWLLRVAERLTMKEVELAGISYSMSSKALGMEMALADLEFHDFSEQHDAKGLSRIAYYLTHAILEGIANDIAGVEYGHGHHEAAAAMLDKMKGFFGWGGGTAPPVES